MRSIKDRYGNKLSKKQKKAKPPYWRVTNLLKSLGLKFRERNQGSALFHIIAPDFGILFRFNKIQPLTDYAGWDILDVDLEAMELNQLPFTENLMWLLISKGYMAYLRNGESGNTMLFHRFIQRGGWGLKIIDKRLELYNNEPRHAFMIKRNKRLRDKSISYILTHHPDFFDYLW